MTIAVDFDGTIVRHRYPAIGKPIPYALDVLKELSADGHHIILYTVREGNLLKDAVEYCRHEGLEFYAVNSEYPDGGWAGGASRKIKADLYIDDRNFGGIPDWPEIYEAVTQKNFDLMYGRRRKLGPIRRFIVRCRRAKDKVNGYR